MITRLCQCGCGGPAPIARQTDHSRGYVRGEPRRFIHGHHTRQPVDNFMVDDDTGCWVWRGHLVSGYGRIMRNGIGIGAHRFHYERVNGAVPPGQELDHLCRNRACVNPAHLEPVSRAENARRGEQTKLTADQVREIRESRLSSNALAPFYGVAGRTIRDIREGRTWSAV